MDPAGGDPAERPGGAAGPVGDQAAGAWEREAEFAAWVDEALALYGDLLPGTAAPKAAEDEP